MSSSWIDVKPVGDGGLPDVRMRFANGVSISMIASKIELAETVELAILTESGNIRGSRVWPNLPIGEPLLKALVLCFSAAGPTEAFVSVSEDPVLKTYIQQWPG
jgi:hypothetical protein